MWKRFKKRVNNWVFEEIEIEENVDINHDEKEDKKQYENPSPKTRIAYQYPRQAPFRFPVIEDEGGEASVDRPERQRPRKANKRVNKQARKRPQRKGQEIYLNEEQMKTIQDVPTYLRRKRSVEAEEPDELVEDESNLEKEDRCLQEEDFPHTTPDELDAIFKKRDHLNKAPREEKEESRLGNIEGPHQLSEDIHEPLSNDLTEEDDFIEEQDIEIEEEGPPAVVDERPFFDDLIEIKEENEPIRQGLYEVSDVVTRSNKKEVLNERIVEEVQEKVDIPYYLLDDPVQENREEDEKWIEEQIYLLERTLTHFNVKAQVVNATQGSSVTRFEVKPEMGVKVSRIRNLVDDIKLNMAAKDIRIEAPIPGRHTVGIEVPNKNAYPVGLQQIIQSDYFNKEESPLTIALGLTIEGEPLVTTIGKMPHCLIAGATGSGKSVCINTILLSLMYKANYDEVKFLLIDPKMVELAPYNGIPYLLSPVITDVTAATASLKWAVEEMERRYELFAKSRVRDIARFNSRVKSGQISSEKMPYIVIVIDELADLMSVSPQDVEDAICRIAQKARACGIHLLLATQRPSVDVITGLIKANIPTRISFSVTSQIDSRTIIDRVGAEKLLGKGDMLFVENGSNEIVRLQGPFVSDDEIERITSHVRSIAEPNYLFEQEQLLEEIIEDEDEDELFEDVIQFILEHNQASTSLLQRRFRIGYNRAARIIDTLEARGIISGQNGTKPREVLITQSQLEQ